MRCCYVSFESSSSNCRQNLTFILFKKRINDFISNHIKPQIKCTDRYTPSTVFSQNKIARHLSYNPPPPTIFERLLMHCMFYVKKLLKVVCNALKFLRASKIGTYHQIWYWALCHSCILQEWAFSLNVNRVLKR